MSQEPETKTAAVEAPQEETIQPVVSDHDVMVLISKSIMFPQTKE